jgi:ribose/xylose/arabinose/galactoside ABC-type transport system permease subunit/ABC-type sugar transport system substrate-binding protein
VRSGNAILISRRTATGLMLASAASAFLAGPARAAEKRTVALLFDSLISPFWVAAVASFRQVAAARGWTLLEAVSNMDDNRQFTQVQSMIQRGVDGIIIVHTDDKAVIPAIRAANAAHIPMVHFNRAPAPSTAYSVAVVADNRRLMRETVSALIAHAHAQGGHYKAAILLGDLAGANGVARRDGFEDAVSANRDIVEVVSRIATEWNADKAFAGLSNALEAHPDLNMIVTSSDFMSPQIEQALRAAGKWHPAGTPGHVLIAGFDGDANGYRNLANGMFDVDGVQDLGFEVKTTVDALERLWAGQVLPRQLVDPGFVADRTRLAHDRSRIWGYALASGLPGPPANVVSAAAGARSAASVPAAWSATLIATVAALFTLSALGDIGVAFIPLFLLVSGQLLVMLLGEIDLSMPAVLALASVASAAVMTRLLSGAPEPLVTFAGCAAALITGILIGAFNGLAVARARMPSFIATLGTLLMGSGIAVWVASSLSETISIGNLPSAFRSLGYGKLAGLPISFLIAGPVALLIGWLLKRTLYGRWIYAVGHNAAAARLSGVPVAGVRMGCFVASGALAGLASIVLTARVETGQPTLGANMLLDIVAAAVIGGVSLLGGRGTLAMAAAGAFFLCLLDKFLQLAGLSLFVVLAVKGAAILVFAGNDILRRRAVQD